jgi:hypothetical protein
MHHSSTIFKYWELIEYIEDSNINASILVLKSDNYLPKLIDIIFNSLYVGERFVTFGRM